MATNMKRMTGRDAVSDRDQPHNSWREARRQFRRGAVIGAGLVVAAACSSNDNKISNEAVGTTASELAALQPNGNCFTWYQDQGNPFAPYCISSTATGAATCAAAHMVTHPASVACNDTPFVNGSFETGPPIGPDARIAAGDPSITGWQVLQPIDYVGSYYPAADGSRSIDLNGDTSGAIQQVFSVVPGENYRVDFSMAGNPGADNGIKSLNATAGQQTFGFSFDTTGKTLTSPGWVAKSFNFTANDYTTALTFTSLTGGGAGPAVDNVRVTYLGDVSCSLCLLTPDDICINVTPQTSCQVSCSTGYYDTGVCVTPPAPAIRSTAPYDAQLHPNSASPSTPTAPGCGDVGMCAPDAHEMATSLNLNDTPVGYAPQKGPPVYVRLSYDHQTTSQPATPNYFNVGSKWTLNTLSYVEDNPANPGQFVTRYVAGGGAVAYGLDAGMYNSTTGAFGPEKQTGAVLTRIPATGAVTSYNLTFPDGAQQIFQHADGASSSPRHMFLTQIKDPAGNALTLNYDSQLRLTSITDAEARNTSFAYANSNPLLVTKITDPFGRHADLAYDTSGRLSSITDVIGITSSFTYDTTDPTFIKTLTTPYGSSNFSFTQNTGTGQRALELTDPMGLTERVEYLPTTTAIPATDTIPSGITAVNGSYNLYNTFYFDKHELPIARPGGPGTTIDYTKARVTHWLHTPGGQPTGTPEAMKQPLENRVFYNYPGQTVPYYEGTFDQPSAIGRILDDGTTQLSQISICDPTNTVCNPLGKPMTIIDPLGRTTKLTYASNNVDLIKVEQKVSATPTWVTLAQTTYNGLHEPLAFTDAANQVTNYAYNGAGQLEYACNALSQTPFIEYDGTGRVTRTTMPGTTACASIVYGTTNTGLPTNKNFTYPSTCTTSGLINCDLPGTVTDSEGWAVNYARDNLDRTTVVTYPDTGTDRYNYTNLDLTSYVDRLGRQTSHAYDPNRRLTSTTDHLGKTVTFAYFEDGQLGAMGDQNGNVTAWGIDLQGRPTVHQRVADGSAEITSYENTTSRVSSVYDTRNQVKLFAYDKANELTGISYINTGGGTNPTLPVTFAYDPYFPRKTSMTDGTNGTASRNYTYVAPGSFGALQLSQESGPFTNDTIGYTYDALGRMATRTVAGDAESFTRDSFGRLSGYNTTLGNFTYNFLGNTDQVASKSVTGPGVTTGAISSSYSYYTLPQDRREYFISNVGGGARSFLFPNNPYQIANGQDIPASTHPWPTTQNWTWGYDANDRVTSAVGSIAGTFNYGYDNAGNPTNFGGSTFGYNGANALTTAPGRTMSYDAIGNTTGDGTHTYTYDTENRTIAATYGTVFSDQTVYDGLGRPVKTTESINGGTPGSSYFLWCGDMICQWRDAAQNVLARYYDGGHGVEGEYTAGTRYFYQKDQLGSVRDVATGTGALVYSADYSPYGATTRATGSIAPRFTFGGMYQVGNIGMLHSRTRDYDPSTGRWLSRDPIKEEGGINLYGYVAAQVTGSVDPSGLEPGRLNGVPSSQADLFAAGNNIPRMPWQFVVVAHGGPSALYDPSGNAIGPEEMAGWIRGSSGYRPGMDVVLHSCETGQLPDGYAQQLANALNTANRLLDRNAPTSMVVAPDKLEWAARNGTTTVADATLFSQAAHALVGTPLVRDPGRPGNMVPFLPMTPTPR